MTHPVEPQLTTTRGWRSVILALVAFLGLPLLPTALRSIVPISETMVLLMALLAVCALVGWWRGGSALFALVWIVLAAWMLKSPLGPADSAYGVLARGWILLLAASFGIVSILVPAQGFFVRALSSLGIAVTGAFMLAIARPDGLNNVRRVMVVEYERRTETTIAWFRRQTETADWREMAKRHPALDSMARRNEEDLAKYPERSATVLPALLALESLAALALAWALYHRLTSVAIGPAFGSLRDFRFNDQLIWGLAVGATIFFLPPFADGKNAGLNLLLFFGAIYLLRGMGVLAWASRRRAVGIGLIVLTAIVPLVAAALALGVGVGDTWMDWRRRIQSPA
jgi:hypothetical protein